MRLVVDASVAIPACASHDGWRPFRRHELVAPPLLLSECLSGLHEALDRGEVSETLARASLEQVASMPVRIRSHTRLAGEAWAIVEQLGWAKTYDAEYLALARLLGCRLLTMDGRLRRGTQHLKITIGPEDLR